MNKEQLRLDTAADMEAFLSAGGQVTILKSAKVKTKNSASGHQKVTFGWKQPHALPSSVWKYIV